MQNRGGHDGSHSFSSQSLGSSARGLNGAGSSMLSTGSSGQGWKCRNFGLGIERVWFKRTKLDLVLKSVDHMPVSSLKVLPKKNPQN